MWWMMPAVSSDVAGSGVRMEARGVPFVQLKG